MIDKQNIITLRMERQFLSNRASKEEYNNLYRDTSPGQNVYWNGFGDPPSMTFRAGFDDIEYNRQRQKTRTLVKGRFQGGNLGWIEQADLELFAGLCRKPLDNPNSVQTALLKLIEQEGPLNIGLMKEMTGMLVKEITPALHRLQEAFLIYEDQYDGEWDREWYKFDDMFPDVDIFKFTRHDALKIILRRFAYRLVLFDSKMAKSFYKLPEKDIKAAILELVDSDEFVQINEGYMLKTDLELLDNKCFDTSKSVFVMHRNDFLVKANEHILKESFKHDEFDTLQYILVDGVFHGAVVGKFKNGPYVLEDVILDLPNNEKVELKAKITEAVYRVNDPERSPLKRYCGNKHEET